MAKRDTAGKKSLQGKFRDHGYKMTTAREVILEILNKTSRHLSAKDIYSMVNKQYPFIGLTTIYRTLDILSSMRLISKFDFGDGHTRYELTRDPRSKDHHHHLVCVSCNRVINYNDFIEDELELIKQTEKGLSKKYNFRIIDHLIQFYGECDKCSQK